MTVPLDEKPPNLQDSDSHKPDLQNLEGVHEMDSNSSAHRHVDSQTDINSNAWSKLPDKIVKKILVMSVRSSDKAIFTFNKLPPASLHHNQLFFSAFVF